MSTNTAAETFWSDSYSINWYDADCYGRLSLPGICRFFEETAWRHAESLGFGYNTLAQQKSLWVIIRLQVKVTRLPCWSDSVTVKTWTRGADRLFAYREFELYGSDGSVYISASSTWLIIDAQSRKPVRPDLVNRALPLANSHKILGHDAEKITLIKDLLEVEIHRVRHSDLDVNGHTNNCKYLEWVLDTFSSQQLQAFESGGFILNFNAEAHLNDFIHLFKGITDDGSTVFEGRSADGKSVFMAKITLT